MSEHIEYWKTWNEGKQSTHLARHGSDYTICGLDLIGDELVHDRPPESLSTLNKRRITCPHCLSLIETVMEHIKYKGDKDAVV